VARFSHLLDAYDPGRLGRAVDVRTTALDQASRKAIPSMSTPIHPTQSQPSEPTQQPPAWQPPPPESGQATNPTPPPRPKRRRRRTVLVAVGVGLVLAIAAVGVTGCGTGQKAAASDAPTTSEAPAPADPGEEGIPDEEIPEEAIPEEKPVEPASKQIGETLTLTDVDTDKDVAKVWITKVETSRGEEYNEPERGNYLGVYVKVKALTDDQSSLWGDFYVVQKGHHYDADGCCPERFEPSLDYVDLNEGEAAEGWMVFDVPARHGEIVLGQSFGGGKIATWPF
jgi:hypothetical protein